MGVYIKGMELPSCEVGCRAYMDFRIWNDGTVEARIGPKETEYKAVPVPPHADLIERDALTISTAVPLDGKPYQYVHIDNIKSAPAIIPAEEGET